MTKNGNELDPGHNLLQQLRRDMMDDVLKPYKLTADEVLDGVPPSKYTSTLYNVMGLTILIQPMPWGPWFIGLNKTPLR